MKINLNQLKTFIEDRPTAISNPKAVVCFLDDHSYEASRALEDFIIAAPALLEACKMALRRTETVTCHLCNGIEDDTCKGCANLKIKTALTAAITAAETE